MAGPLTRRKGQGGKGPTRAQHRALRGAHPGAVLGGGKPPNAANPERAMVRIGIGSLVALVLIFFALLGMANEIRFQGCTARQDRQTINNTLAKRQQAPLPVLKCSRVPFKD